MTVHVGDEDNAGTDANVYLAIMGEVGDTGKRWLKKSNNNDKNFEKDQTDEFEFDSVTVMDFNKVLLGHDGKEPGEKITCVLLVLFHNTL